MQLHPILDQTILKNIPRLNQQFIGISHKLQLKKRQRKQIELEQKAIANRVLFLEKQQVKAQKNITKKKQQLKQVMTLKERNNIYKQQKERLRNLRQLQLQAIRQENKHRRLLHKQLSFNSKYDIYNNKHRSYQIQKNIMSQKQKDKKSFLEEDHRAKKDHWLTINLQKEKGKQRIDKYYKTKNKEHTQAYLEKIFKQQNQKLKKQTTIKQLEYMQSALRKKLEESTMKISQIQQRIVNSSRTIEPTPLTLSRRNSISNKSNSRLKGYLNSKSMLQKYEKNYLQNMLQKDLVEQLGSKTQRNTTSKNNKQQIQQKIQNGQQGQNKGFKIIRTKRRNKHKNRYKQYQLF